MDVLGSHSPDLEVQVGYETIMEPIERVTFHSAVTRWKNGSEQETLPILEIAVWP